MSKIRVACPHCGAAFSIGAAALGKRAKCSHCGAAFTLEAAATAAAASTLSADPPAGSADANLDFDALAALGDRGQAVAVAPAAKKARASGVSDATTAASRPAALGPGRSVPKEPPPCVVALNTFLISTPVTVTRIVLLIGLGIGCAAYSIAWAFARGPAADMAECRRDIADADAQIAKVEADRAAFRQSGDREMAKRGQTVRWPENILAPAASYDAPAYILKDAEFAGRLNQHLEQVNRSRTRLALLERTFIPPNPRRVAILGAGFAAILLFPCVWGVFRRAAGIE